MPSTAGRVFVLRLRASGPATKPCEWARQFAAAAAGCGAQHCHRLQRTALSQRRRYVYLVLFSLWFFMVDFLASFVALVVHELTSRARERTFCSAMFSSSKPIFSLQICRYFITPKHYITPIIKTISITAFIRSNTRANSNKTKMSQPQSQPSSSQESPRPGVNYTDHQKEWIFHAIASCVGVRQTLDIILTRNLVTQVQEQLSDPEWKALHRISHTVSDRTIRDLWRKHLRSDKPAFQKIKSPGRPKIQIADSIAQKLQERDDDSTRRIAAQLGISHMTVWRRLRKDNKCFFYRKRRAQLLSEKDIHDRLYFATSKHKWIQQGRFHHQHLFWGDECMVRVGCGYNRQNMGKWLPKGQQNHHEMLVQRLCYEQCVHVSVIIHYGLGVLEPYFVDEMPVPPEEANKKLKTPNSLNSWRYNWMLNDLLPKVGQRLSPEQRKKAWWSQDGASSHTANECMNTLSRYFGQQIMSRNSIHDWPAHSPDFNLLDYFFWPYAKTRIYQMNCRTVSEIKQAFRDICRTTPLEMIRRAIDDFVPRLGCCIEQGGRHFEGHLKEYKRRHKIRDQCDTCGENHPCPCDDCDRECAERMAKRILRGEFEDQMREVQMDFGAADHADQLMEIDENYSFVPVSFDEEECWEQF